MHTFPFDMPTPLTRYLRLNGEGGTGGVGDGGAGGSGGGGGAERPTFTPEQQAYIDSHIVPGIRDEGRRTGAQQARQEIDAYLQAQKQEQDRAEMAEADRLRAEAADAQAAAQKAQEDAARVQLTADAQAALVTAQLNPMYLADGLALLGHAAGDDGEALKVKVEALKARHPAWFTADSTGSTTPPPPPGIPPSGGRPPTGGAPKSLAEIGKAGLAERGWGPKTAA